jgi:small-conductance mechanosensitive channel
MNDYNNLLNELEQQLAELVATNNNQLQQIERLTAVNRNLTAQNERLNKENEKLANTNRQQNDSLTKLLGNPKRDKPTAKQGYGTLTPCGCWVSFLAWDWEKSTPIHAKNSTLILNPIRLNIGGKNSTFSLLLNSDLIRFR